MYLTAAFSVFNMIVTQISKKTGVPPRAIACVLAYLAAFGVEGVKLATTEGAIITWKSFFNVTFLGTTVWTSATGYWELFIRKSEEKYEHIS